MRPQLAPAPRPNNANAAVRHTREAIHRAKTDGHSRWDTPEFKAVYDCLIDVHELEGLTPGMRAIAEPGRVAALLLAVDALEAAVHS